MAYARCVPLSRLKDFLIEHFGTDLYDTKTRSFSNPDNQTAEFIEEAERRGFVRKVAKLPDKGTFGRLYYTMAIQGGLTPKGRHYLKPFWKKPVYITALVAAAISSAAAFLSNIKSIAESLSWLHALFQ